MRLLLIHQNFPGQFRNLSAEFISRGHEVVAFGRNNRGAIPPGVTLGVYTIDDPGEGFNGSDPYLDLAVRRGMQVRQACQQLRDGGWIPDAVLFHSSWGEGLYLRDVWPQQRLLAYPELYGTARSLGYGFDARLNETPESLGPALQHLNLLAITAIVDSDAAVAPTRHQRDSFPAHLHSRFRVIHEGVDVGRVSPHPQRWVLLTPQLAFRHGDPVITYCSRHLEPLRGLPTFLKGLALLQQRHPTAQAIVVGENSKGYGPASEHPGGYVGEILEELKGELDLSRVHFLGRVSYEQLLGIFQVSAAHVYLTYPYALSWSLLEAMACGAPVIGSKAPPVDEVLQDQDNGLLVDFNRPEELSDAMLKLLEDQELRQRLGAAGRQTVERNYGLQACADAYEALLRGD